MKVREELIGSLREETKDKLAKDIARPENPKYKATLKNLIIQVSTPQ